jgi:TonB-linked SusC/RagA family outer membrane protein
MRKIAAVFPMLMLTCTLAFGQTRTVTGRVTDEKGDPVPFATITEAGTKNATSADANGYFSIKVSEKSQLSVSSTGFQALTQAVTGSTVSFILKKGDTQMTEVTVTTALGIRRNKNTLPYAAQTVSGSDVSQSRSNNFVSALSGKVSGVEIRQGNAMGASTNVVVRGTKSLLNSNQAMFVVDGVPVDNSNTSSSNTVTGRGGFDYGNAAADINPDDIESLTVLKGAAATALYGSRASNGVVMITTKKGRKGLGVTVNSGVTVGKIDKSTYAKYQKEYGAGYSANYSKASDGSPNTLFWWNKTPWDQTNNALIVPTTEDASYGAKFDPNLMVYQWNAFDPASPYYKKQTPWVAAVNDPVSFFETAISTNNNVSVDGGDDKATFKLGYTRNEEKGILPNSKLLKNLVNFGATYKLSDKLTAAGAINFSNIQGKGRYGTGYDDWNVNQQFRQWFQTNVDVQELKEAYMRNKQNITWNWADPTKVSGLYPIYSDNPYFARYENYEQDSRFRYFGNASLTYAPTSWLNFLGRVSLDSYDELQEERFAVGSGNPAAYNRFNRTFREANYDLMGNFNKDLSQDLNLKALLGVNIRRTNVNSIYAATNGGLVVPNLYSLSNSKNPINAPVENAQQIATDGYFGGITLTYKNFLTLDATARQDRASTLPVDNNSYFYPSVSGSFLFSKFLQQYEWLSSGKIRANYAEVGNSAPWGSLQDVYDKPNPFGTATLFSLPNTKNNPELKPERTKSKEIGLEMAFLRNRVGFDVTYYNTQSNNQIMPVSVSTATGYSSKYVNAGTIENKGIELSVYATPVKTRDFSWTANINWTRNRNEVVALYDKSTNLQIASFQGGVSINATLGQPYGTIQGKTWQMLNGEKLVGSNGRYVITSTTNNVIGNINPDWTGGIQNTFKYKDLSLGFLVDMRKGGDVFSLDRYYGMATGLYPESAGLNDLGNPSRNTIANGGGVIMPGVTADGKENIKRVENIYGTYGYAYNPAAAFVYDASYVKLREANITYSLPQSLVSKLRVIHGIDFSIIGRNLWIIHKNLPYSDPEENLTSGNVQGYQSGAYPTTRTIGANLKFKF